MLTKISGGGKGSCIGLVNYLEKETTGNWFNNDQADLKADQVILGIDINKKNLGNQDDKFYQVIISPSQNEQAHVKNNTSKLQDFTREAMEAYASQFGKGIKSQDLVWFAKIEHERTYSHSDKAVQQQTRSEGQSKEGLQSHVHVIVSRTENLSRYAEQKETGSIDRKNPLKLSPTTNHRSNSQGAVQSGFDRSAFKTAVEAQFDRQFSYERSISETFKYANTLKNGSQEERLTLRMEAMRKDPNYSLTQLSKDQSKQPNLKQMPATTQNDLSL